MVKLHQFLPGDAAQVRIDTAQSLWLHGQGNAQIMPLHEFEAEHVALEKWPAGEHFQPHRYFGGEEIFVLSDEFKDEHGNYPSGSRLRSPHMSQRNPYVEVGHGCLVESQASPYLIESADGVCLMTSTLNPCLYGDRTSKGTCGQDRMLANECFDATCSREAISVN